MKRLTARTETGHAYLVNVKPDEQEVDSPYKNTLQCVLDCFERLAQYEDAEEQGRMVVLPIPENEDYEGLKVKYRVFKAKDSTPVEDCFVLRPDKDFAARDALLVYAEKCGNGALAYDIWWWIEAIKREEAKAALGKEET